MNPHVLFLLESTSSGRVFGLDQQTFISLGIQLFNTGFLAIVLAYLLYNPVRNFMRKRTERIKEQISRAENDMAEAEILKKQYEKRLSEIEIERNEILSTARKLAAEKSTQILNEARIEADTAKNHAIMDIEKEKERALDEMKDSMIDISSAMAAKLIGKCLDQEVHDKLLAGTLAELEELSWPS